VAWVAHTVVVVVAAAAETVLAVTGRVAVVAVGWVQHQVAVGQAGPCTEIRSQRSRCHIRSQR